MKGLEIYSDQRGTTQKQRFGNSLAKSPVDLNTARKKGLPALQGCTSRMEIKNDQLIPNGLKLTYPYLGPLQALYLHVIPK